MSLVEVDQHYGENESNIRSPVLSSMHPEYLRFFLNGSLLYTIKFEFSKNRMGVIYFASY
jgi:hypothetical protein